MSEYFTGVTFPQQKVAPSHDATIRRATLADGILNGCELSYSGYTLTMGAGEMIACGRQFVHTSVQNWAVTGATSGYARLVLTIDTTRASTKETFDQIVDSIEYASALDGFLELQRQDINHSGTIYQMVACVVSLGAGGITGIVDQLGATGTVNKPKAGFIYPLAAAVVPEGFLLCDGAAYARSEYPELFAAIGTMYGSGDGATTFNVPDLRNRVPAGASENHSAGEMVGEETHQLTVDEMPSHTHSGFGENSNADWELSYGQDPKLGFNRGHGLSRTGGDQPHNNMQPTTYIHGYIIATGKGTGVSVADIILGAQAIPLGLEYGGVGATDPKTARENLGITPENIGAEPAGAVRMEHLWENASPSSEFEAQTVEFKNINPDKFVVVFTAISGEIVDVLELKPGETAIAKSIASTEAFPAGLCTMFVRKITASTNNSMSFSASYIANSSTGWIYLQAAGLPIPLRIYGIKGVSA